MPLTKLDSGTALVVIDLQKGIASIPCVHPMVDVVKNASALADAFRAQNLPVVLVNVVGVAPGRTEHGHSGGVPVSDWTALLPDLNAQAVDYLVSKTTWGAFTRTNLEAYLRDAGMTQVVICGIATSFGVESTAREAYALGFNVSLAVDAMTDVSMDAHTNSVERIFPRLGETGTTREVISLVRER